MTQAPDGGGGGYGSHQPALRAISRFTKICSVIEFGGGLYSTHLFLDPTVFPDLNTLVTFEHKANWAKQILKGGADEDPRFTLIITAPDNFEGLSENGKVDFVFLDCAPMVTRMKLKYHALTLAPIFAIHDCREQALKPLFKFVKGFNDKIQTVFASNTVDLKELEL